MFELLRCEIKSLLENSEGFELVEQANRQKIGDLENEAFGFLEQCCLGFGDLTVEQCDVLSNRKVCQDFRGGVPRLLWKFGQGIPECVGRSKSLEENGVVDRERKEGVSLARKIVQAILDS